jgi:hypothetical protein
MDRAGGAVVEVVVACVVVVVVACAVVVVVACAVVVVVACAVVVVVGAVLVVVDVGPAVVVVVPPWPWKAMSLVARWAARSASAIWHVSPAASWAAVGGHG